MKEKIRKKTKRPQTEDMIFTEEDFEDVSEETKGNSPKHRKRSRRTSGGFPARKAGIIAGGVVGVLVLLYLGISVFFMSHFYINTTINGKDFSGRSASSVEAYIKEQVKDYKLTIKEQDSKSDVIKGSDISLQYKESDEIEKALKKQNGFAWPLALFSKKSEKISIAVSFDETALNEKIQNLQAATVEQIPAENAKPKLQGDTYVIKEEVYGTAVDMDVLKEKVNQYISEFRSELDMEKEGCYARPKYTKDSKEVQAACDTMNKYLKASITYTMSESVVVDKTLISTWIGVDDNMNVVFDNDAMKAWFTEFGDKYDTVGTTRNLTTPTGKATTVTGGTYGWSIDEDTELVNLQNSIKNGEVVTREPAYYTGGAAKSHGEQDWGTTFIEVDLSTQHMWYIKDGSVAMETDVVTGVPVPERITPEGVYDILEMTRDEVLIGETDPSTGKPIYETPVNYWMRVTWTGIGFHDATWQAAFGGTRYKDGAGSHGCINMPLDQAAALFGMISVGTPVVIHY